MMNKSLSQSDNKKLKSIAHNLKPVINIGKEGLSVAIVKAINKALDDHELIKIQLLDSAMLDRKKDSISIAKKLDANLVQVLGFKLVLYRYNAEKETHVLEN